MKRYLLLLALLFAACSAYAQNFEGVGEFRIGMTYNEFQLWLKANNIVLEKVRDGMEAYKKSTSGSLMAYIPLPNDARLYLSPSHVNYVSGHKSIVVTSYSPAGIRIAELDLLFKNDVLINIGATMSDQLEEALVAKYGEPQVKTESKTITCRFTYTGVTQDKSEIFLFQSIGSRLACYS